MGGYINALVSRIIFHLKYSSWLLKIINACISNIPANIYKVRIICVKEKLPVKKKQPEKLEQTSFTFPFCDAFKY